jgi:ribonucleoside-diphosphate reductase alpha chain
MPDPRLESQVLPGPSDSTDQPKEDSPEELVETRIGFPNLLSEFVFTRTYSRWLPEKGRRETWVETVERYIDFITTERKLPKHIVDEIRKGVLAMEVLPSMRALWSAGDAARRDNTSMYNCLGVETEFITSKGVQKFSDFKDGDKITVLTHTGAWKPAVVRSYGQQQLFNITLARGRSSYTVRATRDHQWLLADGERTNDISSKMKLTRPPRLVGAWQYGDSTPEVRNYWAMGYVYGDGTLVKDRDGEYKYSMVRLCGEDKGRFLDRFKELGFSTSEPPTFGGDALAYTGHYLKTLPSIEKDGFENVLAFVRGYLDADGHKNRNTESPSPFDGIQASGGASIDFIRNVFPAVGAYITREDDLTGEETNFGVRPETSRFGLVLGFGDSPNALFSVQDIQEASTETVWCLEVEDDHSFVLPNGIVTGNCAFVPLDSLKSFVELLYVLMIRTGVGFSVEHQFVNHLPLVAPLTNKTVDFVVPDSTNGWADSFFFGLQSWFHGNKVNFDYSQVRSAGAPLKTKGGRASGPDPLRRLFLFAEQTILSAAGRRLKSIEAHDIACMIGEIVMSGGVRRAATISISDVGDEEMRHAKDFSRGKFPQYRFMANNSAFYPERPSKEVFWQEWAALMQSSSGERGFSIDSWHLRADRPRAMVRPNPCGEIGLRVTPAKDPVTGEGGGGQFCNLSAAVMRGNDTRQSFARKVRLATWIGAIQSTFTHFPYLRPAWAKACNEDRLLGVDITGQCDNPKLSTDPEAMAYFNKVAVETAAEAAAYMGINMPVAITCGKPSGNSSQLVDCASGFHPRWSAYYIRRVRINGTDPLFKLVRDQGVPVHKDNQFADWSDEKCPTWVVDFPVKAPTGAMTRNDETALQQCERYLHVISTWCGNRGHNQSATIYVRPEEWEEVGQWLWENLENVTGLSFLPYDSGKYTLAPYEEITKEQYEAFMAKMPQVEFSVLSWYEQEDRGEGAKELACSGGSCSIDYDKASLEAGKLVN